MIFRRKKSFKTWKTLTSAFLIFVFLFSFFPTPTFAVAGIVKQIHFQGTLKDSLGTAVANGSYNFKFSIYDAATIGTCLWTAAGTCGTPTAVSLTVTSGEFSVYLGGSGQNALTLDFNDDSYYLGITVGTNSEMSPRQRVGAMGYAFNADTIDGIHASTTATASQLLALDGGGDFDLGTGAIIATNADFEGDINLGNDTGDALNITALIQGSSPLVFEGVTTGNGFETTFAITDPTADRTVTFQNASGTVAFLSDVFSGSLSDNTTNAYDLQEGSNNYININTTNGSETVTFGNATTNPDYVFLGSGGITVPNYIDFATPSNPAYAEGRVFYDTTLKELSFYNDDLGVQVNLGRDIVTRVYNSTGSTLGKGKVVYINGAFGIFPTVALAKADAYATSQVLGFVADDIITGSYGYVVSQGFLQDIDTSAFTAGDQLFLSAATAGAVTVTIPAQPNVNTLLGNVIVSNAITGKIFVNAYVDQPGLFTAGTLVFGNTDGQLTGDHTNFYWDDTSNRLGIGDNTPAATLTVGSGDLFEVFGASGNVTTQGDITLTTSGGAIAATGGGLSLSGAGASSFTSTSVLTLTGASASTWSTSSGALTLTSAAASTWGTSSGNLTLQVAGTGTTANVQIGAGGAGSVTPDLFVLDAKSSSGDPTGTNGAMYYNANSNRFRCYQSGGWKDCDVRADDVRLDELGSATTGNVLSNGDNAQTWNWALTTANNAGIVFGESSASTATGAPAIVKASTLASSTAMPLFVQNLGAGDSFRVNDATSDTSPFLIDENGNVAIGSDVFDGVAPERLKVVMPSGSTSYNVISGQGDVDNYLQLNIQNLNAGTDASSDVVATSDNGDENIGYVDMGINSSGYSNPAFSIGGANDAYIYAAGGTGIGGNLTIGTGDAGTALVFHTAGTTSTDERMRITDDGSGNSRVGIGTISPGSTLDVRGVLRLSGSTSGYVGFAPAATAGSTVYTLPSADGTSGQALITNGSGVLSWQNATPVFQRVGTVISPITSGDDITTSGDMYTSSGGTITSNGLLSGNAGLTVIGGVVNLNASSNNNTNINTGTSTGTIAIGNSSAGSIGITSGSGLTLTGGATSSFSTTSGAVTFQAAGTGTSSTIQIGAGGAGSTTPDLFALDVKSSAGDPTGVNGSMYYNENTDKFRCYVNGSWSDCDTTGGSTTLQSAYNAGAVITTAGSTDIALTLTSGNLTASGAGAVNLTPTSASSFTSGGALTLTGGAASIWGTSSGNLTLQVAGTGATANVQIGAGGAGSTTPDLFALDVKSSAGDPTGFNGAMYYSENLDDFRCYVNGGWQSCGATAASATTLQQAYDAGATITTAGSTDIAFTLTSGNLTATGAGAVNLTPTSASSFTSGGALTLTGGAASTWGTSSGALSIDSAAALNLGNTNTTSVSICNSVNCDILSLGTNADADTITIGDVSDSTALNSANWSIATSGLFTTASDFAVNGADITTTSTGTATIFNTNATTLNLGGAATTLNLGGALSAVNLAALTASKVVFTDASKNLTSTGTVNIDQGGTGATTQTTAFNALSPLTTKGDLVAYNGTNNVRLPVGITNGHVLMVDSTQSAGIKWASVASSLTDVLNFTEFSDTLSLDAVTSIALGGNNLSVTDVGSGALSFAPGGAITLTAGTASTWGTSSGNLTLQVAGTGTTATIQIGAGGAGSTTPDLFALDVKSSAGDPTGFNGAMYYNENTDKFRCYVNGSWSDCDTTGGSTTLQSAYNAGATITTAGSTDVALTLTSGNLTATGAGAVTLTPTSASSFTSGGALTFTAGAASTWKTTTGNLLIDSAATLNLGTTDATALVLGSASVTATVNGPLAVSKYIDFTAQSPDPSYAEGRVFYDDTHKSLTYFNEVNGISNHIGETTWIRVKNSTGITLPKGKVVYVNGTDGSGFPTVALAQANSVSTAQATGILTADIANGAYGYATFIGKVENLDTSSFTAGDVLYLSATSAGDITTTKPSTPNLSMPLGVVTKSHATTGIIEANITSFQLGSLTTGSVAFSGTNGLITEDNSNFFWDDTNNRLGLGDITPAATLTVGSGDMFQVQGSTGNVTTAGTLAVNGGTINTNGALTINSATTNALTLDSTTTGAVNIGTGASAKTITMGNITGATALNIDVGTGGINFGDNANTKTIDIGGVTSSGTDTINIATNSTAADVIIIGNSNASTALALTGGDDWSITAAGLITTAGDAGINGGDITTSASAFNLINSNATTLNIGGAATTIAIGASTGTTTFGNQIVTDNLGVEFAESDTNPTCAAGNFGIYADLSENKLKKCQNGTITDLDTGGDPDTATFVDTTADSAVSFTTANTDLWDPATNPNITPTSTAQTVLVAVTVAGDAEDGNDASASLKIVRNTGTDPACTDTQIGSDLAGSFSTVNTHLWNTTAIFLDSPATTSNVRYTVCTTANGIQDGDVNTITFTLVALGADLAENYYTNDSTIEPGDLVVINPSLPAGVQKSTKAYDRKLIGVISTAPGLILDDATGVGLGRAVPVALAGRIPVKVSTENGIPKAGDYLTASSMPGVAMKATKAGVVIGQAMHDYNYDSEVGLVSVFVKNGYWNGEIDQFTTSQETTSGNIFDALAQRTEDSRQSEYQSSISTDRIVSGFEIITPNVITQKMSVDQIHASVAKDLKINLALGKGLQIHNVSGEVIASVDEKGDAIFNGLTVRRISVDEITGPALQVMTDVLNQLTMNFESMQNEFALQSTRIALLTDEFDGFKLRMDILELAQMNAPEESKNTFLSDKGGVLSGGLQVDYISGIAGERLALGDTSFIGRPYFNSDTAGFAKIATGEREVEVMFDEMYLEQPVVNITLAMDYTEDKDYDQNIEQIFNAGYQYLVTHKSVNGFTILLNKDAEQDLTFSWITLAVKNPKIFENEEDDEENVESEDSVILNPVFLESAEKDVNLDSDEEQDEFKENEEDEVIFNATDTDIVGTPVLEEEGVNTPIDEISENVLSDVGLPDNTPIENSMLFESESVDTTNISSDVTDSFIPDSVVY